MLVVEFRVDAPILQDTLDGDPTATVTNEELYQDGDEIKYLFWAESDDFDAFEGALAADSTVTNTRTLAETNTRRLYRVTFTEEGADRTTFPVWSDLDLVILDATATREGGQVRMRIPDREALAAFRETCRNRGFSFHLESVYRQTEGTSTADARLSAPSGRRSSPRSNPGTSRFRDARRSRTSRTDWTSPRSRSPSGFAEVPRSSSKRASPRTG